MNFRSSASFGKRQEYITVAEPLRRGHTLIFKIVPNRYLINIVGRSRKLCIDLDES
jgi:hypothetical protein